MRTEKKNGSGKFEKREDFKNKTNEGNVQKVASSLFFVKLLPIDINNIL